MFDNNISPKIAHAIKELCHESNCEVIHLKDRFSENEKDVNWQKALIDEGGWGVVSIDRFNKNEVEKEAMNSKRLITFILASGYPKLAFWEQSHRIIRWVPQIMKQMELNSYGVFEIPINFGTGKFKQITAKYVK